MNQLCAALKRSAEQLWMEASIVEKSDPEHAKELRALAKSDAKLADELANKQAASRKGLS